MSETISAGQLKELLPSQQITLIDVRTAEEFYEGYIEGSILLPLDQIIAQHACISMTSNKIVLICKAGVRSATALAFLKQADPTLNLYNLSGGILAWQKIGGALVKPGDILHP